MIINDAAEAYRGVIPADCFHDPYMSSAELQREIDAGVCFWGAETDEILAGMLKLQRSVPAAVSRQGEMPADNAGCRPRHSRAISIG